MQSITRQSTDVKAPYADTAIELSLMAVTTQRYKTYYCIECKHPFLQRDDTTYYRINSQDEPVAAYASEGQILAKCGRCSQKYVVSVSLLPTAYVRYDIQLNRSSQSIYLQPAEDRSMRFIRCLECGNTFVSVTDRISKVVDNCVPLEYVATSRVAHIEVRCKTGRCRQRWALVI